MDRFLYYAWAARSCRHYNHSVQVDHNNTLLHAGQAQRIRHSDRHHWVRETRFGHWFLRSDIWRRYVLVDAVHTLRRLLERQGAQSIEMPRILDAGCGYGASFGLIAEAFQPQQIVAVDIDQQIQQLAGQRAAACATPVSIRVASVYDLPLDTNSMDAVFCHQLLHHLTDPRDALAEIYRVLKPGGWLLLTESCAPFMNRWWVRWLFRHPRGSKKTGSQYLREVAASGFESSPDAVDASRPWWSQFWLGLADDGAPVSPETASEIAIVARKPANH